MATMDPRPLIEPGVPPVITGEHTPGSVTDDITRPIFGTTKPWWLVGLAASFALLMLFLMAAAKLVTEGTGIWGLNIPVAWGFAIINFVWWIGIGHAGTLISAILLLFRQDWRTSINRFAEAMTLFAVACAGMFPILHLGRPWLFYWLMPYPNQMSLWPQFQSPLIWDVFAVSTYATVSLLFWFTGLIPDLASLRDRAKNIWIKRLAGIFSLGWRGSSKHWQNYESLYLLLAGLSTPLVLSVHTVVSFDFAISIVPGWHTTVFPPYFVAGAVFAGFAMVFTLMLPLRPLFGLHNFITDRHLQAMAKVMLTTGLIVAYGYIVEIFVAWYSGNTYEWYMVKNRFFGPFAFQYMMLWVCNIVIPQFLWIKKVRTSPWILWLISMAINVGMWLERYIIVVVSLSRDFLPSSWDVYAGTRWDWAVYVGTIGLFMTLIFLFIRFLPVISIFEVRHLAHEKSHH
ncbi:MAG: NrfD/PsrC family molybdoenzyme membrane anchor subunit [Acidobacteriota bacterium]